MKTTFSRTLFPAAIILLAALLLVGTGFQVLVRNYMDERTVESLKKDGAAISALASAYYIEDSMSDRAFLTSMSLLSQVTEADAVICDATGRLILCSEDPLGCEHQGLVMDSNYLQQALSSSYISSTGRIDGLYSDTRYVVAQPIHDAFRRPVGIVIVSIPITETRMLLDQMSDIFLFVSLLVVLAAVILMTFLARQQAQPLRDMAKAARAFGHGHLQARVQVDESTPEEVQELALAFNNMASSLQKSEYQRQEFVANVSHELKTPMTTISGMVDGILDGTIPPEKQHHYMQLVSDETKRLSRLVRSMLDISRLQDQGGIPEEKKTRFDACECAGQVLISFEQKILAKELEVDVDMPAHPVYAYANQDYIIQVIYNLLDNAVKFCPQQGTLGLRLRIGTSKLYLSISNTGSTIPPEELPLVFDRFHKLDKSRSQNRDGWGLGLYIVKTIIDSHGENISVSSKNGKTEFTFTLPVVN